MNIQLVRAVTTDVQEILQMQKICFTPHLLKYQDYEINPAAISPDRLKWQIENETFFKIICDDLWVGGISVRKLDDAGNYKIQLIFVLPQYQGKKIGQSAMKAVEELFHDWHSWCLETVEDMLAARHMYEKMGYIFTGETYRINKTCNIVFYRKEI